MLYMNGEGVSKNQALGLYWIQSAADRGDDRAATYLKNLD
jgi:TPR repeat protein